MVTVKRSFAQIFLAYAGRWRRKNGYPLFPITLQRTGPSGNRTALAVQRRPSIAVAELVDFVAQQARDAADPGGRLLRLMMGEIDLAGDPQRPHDQHGDQARP